MESKSYGVHVLLIPYPSQGHVNPMYQFSKRLASKGLKTTLAITRFISSSFCPKSDDAILLDTISDGFDQGGFKHSKSIQDYLETLEYSGSKTLAELIIKYKNTDHPIDCIVYDAFLPWVLDVAKQFGLLAAAFFTQACAVNYIYYHAHNGLLSLPVESTRPVSIPGLPLLQLRDMPSFIYVHGSYPAYFEMVLSQFSNTEKADVVLVNTFYKLEEEVAEAMAKVCPFLSIGPTIPSMYLDKRIESDTEYAINLFSSKEKSICIDWLNTKPPQSVLFVSFGSMANLSHKQIEELAYGFKSTTLNILWVTSTVNFPETLLQDIGMVDDNKWLIVTWSPQIEVLSHEAVVCFFTHCGWNSTIEALSLGVLMVGMPQWTDQTTDAKLIEDVWKVGVRVNVGDDGIVTREEIESCVRKVVQGEKREEMKKNALKWRDLAIEAVSEGGTSDKNIDEFVSMLINR
ncbi:hypothetical protein ACFE04_007098 [Oxalis oulophora]